MITPFNLAATPTLIFGCGKISELPQIIHGKGKRVLIITGARSFQSSPQWVMLQEQLESIGLQWFHQTIEGEPSPKIVDEVTRKYVDASIDLVISIGGGSVIDGGKAIAAMLGKRRSVKEYLEGVGDRIHDGTTVGFIAVPTTSGTGSEATKNAVLSQVGINGFKKSLRHDNFIPDLTLVDPELTLNCSTQLTANTGMDAFTQLLESYLSTHANPVTDALALSGLFYLKDALPIVVANGKNIEARTSMAYASLLSGMTLANAGLGTVHGVAGVIGGYFDAPHGAVCGTLMSAMNQISVRNLRKLESQNEALAKYALVGRLFSEQLKQSDAHAIDSLLSKIEDWTDQFNIPKLSVFNITRDDHQRIIAGSSNKNNPIKLQAEDLLEVLQVRN